MYCSMCRNRRCDSCAPSFSNWPSTFVVPSSSQRSPGSPNAVTSEEETAAVRVPEYGETLILRSSVIKGMRHSNVQLARGAVVDDEHAPTLVDLAVGVDVADLHEHAVLAIGGGVGESAHTVD